MLIHSPYELPSENSLRIYAENSESVDVLVTPEIVRTDESLNGMGYRE
jgi:hypothetical protein